MQEEEIQPVAADSSIAQAGASEIDCLEHDNGNHLQDYIVIVTTSFLLLGYWIEWVPAIFGVNTALIAAVIGGLPIVKEAAMAIYRHGDTKVGLLVSIAIIASIAIGEYFAAAEVALIMTIGEMLEHITLEKSNTALKKLAELAPLKARIIEDGTEREIAAELVKAGDRLFVKQGEKVPVDGVAVCGSATIDQSTITGESIPIECRSGIAVFGGTVVTMGSLEMLATKVGQDTALGHIIKMVKEAQASKAPSARIIDRWATWFVPLSLAIAALVYLVTGDIVRGVTILIVFCPCAMLLSTPTAVAAAIGSAARRGILIKGGETLEKAGSIDTVLFDKTGTITIGEPVLKDVRCFNGWQENDLLSIAAGIEKQSEHHLAKAIICAAERAGASLKEPTAWEPVIGQGIVAGYDGRTMLLGNKSLIEARNVAITQEQQEICSSKQKAGETVVFVAADNCVIGILAIQDPIREGSKNTVQEINQSGIKKVVLLTGDSAAVGNAIAEQVHIPLVHGDLLPSDKVRFVESYQQSGFRVAMVGDGINDAPALAKADIGIAMGRSGTDIAVEAADIVLLSDDLNKIPETIRKSKQAIRTIWQNIIIANVINFAAIVFAASGLLGPVIAAIVHNVGAIIVVLNSARLLRHD